MISDSARDDFARTDSQPTSGQNSSTRPRFQPGRRLAAAVGSALSRVFSRKLTAGVVIGAALITSMPAVAQAGPLSATIVLGSKVFPTGAPVPGGLFGDVPVTAGSAVKLTAPEYLYQPSVPPGALGTVYEFMFWDVNSALVNTETAHFTAPSAGTDFRATAWYLPVCVVASSCSGTGPSYVTTWAFSLTNDKVLPGTPIASVTPSSAWASPSPTVSTATAVNIAAQPYIGPHSKFGGTVFSSWFVFGGASTVTVSGPSLDVPAGESPYAIAFYNQYTYPIPPPCIGYPYCI